MFGKEEIVRLIKIDSNYLLVTNKGNYYLYDIFFKDEAILFINVEELIKKEFIHRNSKFLRFKFKKIKDKTPYLYYLI